MMDARSAANKMLGSMRSSCCHLGYGPIWQIEMLMSENSSVPGCQSQGRWHRGNHVITSVTTYPLVQYHDSQNFTSGLRHYLGFWHTAAETKAHAYSFLLQGWQYQADLLWNFFCNLKISKKWQFLSSFSNCFQFKRHVNLYKWELKWQSHILPCMRKN